LDTQVQLAYFVEVEVEVDFKPSLLLELLSELADLKYHPIRVFMSVLLAPAARTRIRTLSSPLLGNSASSL
jgi:hypothetical protein